jgi:pimeloyl-ACP methyl ester carboxylesterase
MLKKILFFASALVLMALIAACVFFGPYAATVQHFEANAEKGYHADFYVYVSPGAQERAEKGEAVTLLVQPNNSGRTSDDVAVHQKDAWWMGFERKKIADELNVVLLVPAFIRPSTGWEIYTHALDRDVLTTKRQDLSRLDLQLIAMIAEARAQLKEEGINSHEKFLLQGFSASGMFANRFTMLHPEKVMAVALGSPGGWPIAPVRSHQNQLLNYPAGINDLETLTGKPFDSVAYANVPQLIYLGSDDDNDSLDFTDGWDKDAAAQVDSLFGNDPITRWPHAQALYKKASAHVRFVLVEGAGHDRKKLQSLGTEFFQEILDE